MTEKSEKKNSKKSLLLFLLMLFGCMLIGGIIGGWMTIQQDSVKQFMEWICNTIQKWSPWMAVLITIAGMILTILIYIQCKRAVDFWNGEDEEYIEKLEKKCSIGQIILIITMIFIYSFDAIAMLEGVEGENVKWIAVPVIDLLIVMALSTFMQHKYVNLIKKINPEKRGSVVEFNFKKTWMKSCDEQERMAIYRSSYRSFQVMQGAFPICWCILLLLSLCMNIGVIPFLMIGVLWILHTITYCLESLKVYDR